MDDPIATNPQAAMRLTDELDDSSGWSWSSWQVILILINACLGLIAFEWAWWNSRRFRKPIAELEDLMPAFRRTDSHKWSKWALYPGAMTILIPRFLFGVVDCLFIILFVKIVLIGQPMNEPIRGCRRVMVRWIFKFFVFFFQLICNFLFVTHHTISMEDVDYYQKWLGPREEQEKEQFADAAFTNEVGGNQHNSTDFSDNMPSPLAGSNVRRIPKRGKGPPATVVCNHIGWIEVLAMIQSPLHPGFTPKADLESAPLLGTLCRSLQSLFIARGASEAEREQVVEQIKERQRAIEEDQEEYNPLCIFAEGTTTNGTALMKFKRGAFVGIRTVVPCYVKFSNRMVSPTYDTLGFWELVIFYLSSFCFFHLKLTRMPEFTPTHWMLNNHRSKGEADWEIYAQCVREAIAQHGQLDLCEMPVREKMAYEDLMMGAKTEVQVQGKTFQYPPHSGVDDNYMQLSSAVAGEDTESGLPVKNASIQ